MLCPFCSHSETKVTDKRDVGKIARRRRECLKCGKRFSTHETIELQDMKVVKKDGQKEAFDRDKVKRGISKACEKRPVTDEQKEKMVTRIEERIRKKGNIIKSRLIGEFISGELKKTDKVSYIRFASVYRDFADLGDFRKEIRELLRK